MNNEITLKEHNSIYKNRFLELIEDKVDLHFPDGRIVEDAQRTLVKKGGAVVVVAVREDGKIAIVKQSRYGANNDYIFELPAGVIDDNEDPQTAAIRETNEEVGYSVKSCELLFDAFTSPAWTSEYLYLYYIELGEKTEQDLDHDEYVEVHFYTESELDELIFSNQIKDFKTIAGYLYAKTASLLPKK
ncbi:MAG: NUDIX hydrolase [Bifidobacteriaceae bacterium]|jgi:ADP-ribose pyrophosphatase|nr:NUDIX hydrolase [Bifidobacteriaceae bacterium]